MDAYQEIRQTQRAWAKSRGIPFDSHGYVRSVEDNLWKPLTPHAQQAFNAGAARELSGRMRALHSSSALVANVFDYWTDKDLKPLTSALGIDCVGEAILDFEAQFETGLSGTPPHLDVSITRLDGFVVAIESKFTEHMERATRGKSEFRPSYFPGSRELWTEKDLPACQSLAQELREEELSGGRQRVEYLDPRQLLKHALGLATHLGNRFNLYYLFFDCLGDLSEAHRSEVDLFGERVGHELGFKALSYQEVYARLDDFGQVDSEYLDYLGARYFRPSTPVGFAGCIDIPDSWVLSMHPLTFAQSLCYTDTDPPQRCVGMESTVGSSFGMSLTAVCRHTEAC